MIIIKGNNPAYMRHDAKLRQTSTKVCFSLNYPHLMFFGSDLIQIFLRAIIFPRCNTAFMF